MREVRSIVDTLISEKTRNDDVSYEISTVGGVRYVDIEAA